MKTEDRWGVRQMNVLDYIKDDGTGQVIWAITNVCNAGCSFCSYPKGKAGATRYVDYETACKALDIMEERNWRMLSFTGGEPLLNPESFKIISTAVKKGFITRTGTNGRLLTPEVVSKLQETGLRNFWISIDSEDEEKHDLNRGLPGVMKHIKEMVPKLKEAGVNVNAAVAVNKLIGDFERLIDALLELGLDTVAFCYPMTVMEASYGGAAESDLVEFNSGELVQALETIRRLKKEKYRGIRVVNPDLGLQEIINAQKGQLTRYPCLGGYKFFYLDWNLTLYRCAYLAENFGNLLELPRDKDFTYSACDKCMWQCFRDPSVYYHLLGSMNKAGKAIRTGEVREAWRSMTSPEFRGSMGAWLGLLKDRGYA